MNRILPYPPPWQDAPTLCAHLSISEGTLDNWIRRGILPAARERGGKRMWKWAEVEHCMEGQAATIPANDVEGIAHATREAARR